MKKALASDHKSAVLTFYHVEEVLGADQAEAILQRILRNSPELNENTASFIGMMFSAERAQRIIGDDPQTLALAKRARARWMEWQGR